MSNKSIYLRVSVKYAEQCLTCSKHSTNVSYYYWCSSVDHIKRKFDSHSTAMENFI